MCINKSLKKNPYLAVTLLYFLIAGFLPTLCILLEFREGNLGWTYSKLYSPLFYYPLIFGTVATYFFLRPFKFLLSLPNYCRFGLSKKRLLALVTLMTLIILVVDLAQTAAIWEISPNVVDNNPNWADTIRHVKNPPVNPERQYYGADERKFKVQQQQILRKRKKFVDEISNVNLYNFNNFSITHWFYLLSLYTQSFVLLSMFWTVTFFSIPRFRERILKDSYSPQKKSSNFASRSSILMSKILKKVKLPQLNTINQNKNNVESLKKNVILLSVSILFGLIWFPMRVEFERSKLQIYGDINAVILVIGSLYIISVILITYNLVAIFKEKAQAAITVLGTVASIGVSWQIWQFGFNVLGSKATLQNYLICLLGIVIFLWPWCWFYRDTLNE